MKRSRIVDRARLYLGYSEENGKHKQIIDYYNNQKNLPRGYKMKYTDSWCACFVSVVAMKEKATDIIPTECSCQQMIERFKKLGEWHENEKYTPKAGDIIFYDWDDNGTGDCKGFADHVGIVERVNFGTIVVIEGNKSNKVARRYIENNSRYIRGYGLPRYEEEKKVFKEKETSKQKKEVREIAKEVINGKWGNGQARKDALKKAGYNPEEIQKEVNKILL